MITLKNSFDPMIALLNIKTNKLRMVPPDTEVELVEDHGVYLIVAFDGKEYTVGRSSTSMDHAKVQ